MIEKDVHATKPRRDDMGFTGYATPSGLEWPHPQNLESLDPFGVFRSVCGR